jgi:glycosyltransferase involved in cell wall biosynthesis
MESKIKLNMASLLYTPSLKSKLESCNKLDILHFHNFRTYQNYVAYNYVQKTNTPYILQAHGSIPRIGKKELKWIYDVFFGYRLLRDASKVIALSKVEAEQYRRMSIPEGKIAIIPNGIDLSESAELLPKGGFKKKFNIPEDKKIILYLGRIYRIKGIDLLIRAYAYLTKKMRYKDAILVIVGPDDGYLNKVKSLAYDLEVSNSVLFTGLLYGKDKLQAFADSEVYVLPSRYETFPMTVLEAYACSKPVIASKVGGLTDLVIDGETGLLFEPENIEQLANSMLLLLNNHDKAEDLGLRGKQFVNSNFSIESVVDKLEKFYEEVVGR